MKFCARSAFRQAAVGLLLAVAQTSALAYEVIRPGPKAWEQLRDALALLQPGETVALSAGVFRLQEPLIVAVEGTQVRGAGSSRTILSFTPEAQATIGIHIRANGVRISGISVQDAEQTAISLHNSVGVSLRDVRLESSASDTQTDTAQNGLSILDSQDILILDTQVRGIAGAAIHIDRSARVMVHGAQLQENALGIGISDSEQVDIRGSQISHNGIGIWTRDTPDNDRHSRRIRIFDNDITDNSDFRFSLHNHLAQTPPFGTGIAISGARRVEIYSNQIHRHGTTNLLIGRAGNSEHPDQISVHSNSFGASGYAPDLQRAELVVHAAASQLAAIVWDGAAPWPEMLGLRPSGGRILIGNNQGADFVNLNLPWLRWARALHLADRDIGKYSGTAPPLPPLRFAVATLRAPSDP